MRGLARGGYVFLLACALMPVLLAQDVAAFAAAVQKLRAATALSGAHIGVAVVDMDRSVLLASHDAELAFMPASNQKLLTAALSLVALGGEAVLRTTVDARAAPLDGVIAGDLWLCGSGDPSLGGRLAATSMAPMQELAEQMFAAGVRLVAGRVIGVGEALPCEPFGRGWQLDWLTAGYAAPCSGLCFHENVVDLWLSGTGVVSSLAQLRSDPPFGLPPFSHEVRCGALGAETALQWQAPPVTLTSRLSGSIAADALPVRRAVPVVAPAQFAAQALRAALLQRGIAVVGAAVSSLQAEVVRPVACIELAHVDSPPVRTLLRPMLKDSVNLYAEQLWRVAAARGGGPVTNADCERHALLALGRLGVVTKGMVMADGSGLSRRNLVTPRQITQLLQAVWQSPHCADFVDALAIAGRDGTLLDRLRAGPAALRVLAKTGSMDYVSCLSGYLQRPEALQAPLAFAILVNGITEAGTAAAEAIDACVEDLARAVGWEPVPR
jgi:D-alanyl-D-alanine carboxypeptidase/D-alanyl-D-alanine-endopeptidase (penicillin-binding protein 4)